MTVITGKGPVAITVEGGKYLVSLPDGGFIECESKREAERIQRCATLWWLSKK